MMTTNEHGEKVYSQDEAKAMKEQSKKSNPFRAAYPTNGRMHPDALGLTKREYFAAVAMQGILANPELFRIAEKHNADALDIYTKSAIQHADELLKQLES